MATYTLPRIVAYTVRSIDLISRIPMSIIWGKLGLFSPESSDPGLPGLPGKPGPNGVWGINSIFFFSPPVVSLIRVSGVCGKPKMVNWGR